MQHTSSSQTIVAKCAVAMLNYQGTGIAALSLCPNQIHRCTRIDEVYLLSLIFPLMEVIASLHAL